MPVCKAALYFTSSGGLFQLWSSRTDIFPKLGVGWRVAKPGNSVFGFLTEKKTFHFVNVWYI
ncbi:MAG: hypothetical protein BWK80_63395 [Desulfobacteraceae bacterium IS3]|nr:MAG: hypothetical protein BWK80_63395 [Desulfobacteraceae bacterium IS3]